MRNMEMCPYGCRGVGFCEMASINWNDFDLSLLIVFDIDIAIAGAEPDPRGSLPGHQSDVQVGRFRRPCRSDDERC